MTTRYLTRREALKLGALGTGVLLLPPALQSATASHGATTDFHEITQRAATHEFIPGISSPIWGYNGRVPGPTIMVRKGRRVVVTHFNRLSPGGAFGNMVVPFPQEHAPPLAKVGTTRD
jgi:FtsP/CotA-like multicopper oxidase with cupredoxin domain